MYFCLIANSTNHNSTPLQNLKYTDDNVGNVQTISDTVRSELTYYWYDDLNRLTTAYLPGIYWTTWNYTPLGNIGDHDGTTYSYNDSAHKHAVTQMGTQYYCYDANGNMTKHNATSSSCTTGDTFTYDVENRLTQVVTSGGVTTTYVYDGDGNRIKKVVSGAATYYVGNYYEVSGSTTTKYYYPSTPAHFAGTLRTCFGSQRVTMNVNGQVTYLHGDHLGSIIVTDGAVSSTQAYYPYGATRSTSGSVPTDFGFTGQRFDASDSLMYYGRIFSLLPNIAPYAGTHA